MKILIDNGHGWNTPGKCSPDKTLREYQWNREIANRIHAELTRIGWDAELIVPEEGDTTLGERCRRANTAWKAAGRDAILVSVHVNAAGNGAWMSGRGWEAYTTKGKTKADELATYLYKHARKNLPGIKMREDWSDGDPDKEDDFYILKHTSCPAVLTENLFMDNKEDLAFIASEEGKQAIVQLHVDGIIDYLRTEPDL